jgi:glycosyltransferase involved in cell wall biosynthesis
MNPKVSIIMPTWNRAHLLGRAIESVRAQSFKDWELIISDDGSTDNTPEVVKSWLASLERERSGQKKEPHAVYVRSGVNQGPAKNYNQGFRLARGEYVAIHDDDDAWCDSRKLEKQIAFLDKNPDYAACGGGMIVVDAKGKELYRYLKPETDLQIREHMFFSNPMANSTTVFRRAAAEAVGWYDGTLRYNADRDFWFKMGLRGKLYNFPEYFGYYTMSGENISMVKMREHFKVALLVMRRYKKNYPHYLPALAFNWIQYVYSFLPPSIEKPIHRTLARLKRLVAK